MSLAGHYEPARCHCNVFHEFVFLNAVRNVDDLFESRNSFVWC